MSTLTVQIPDNEFAELEALARQDNLPVEEEAKAAIRQYATTRRQRPPIADRAELLREAEALHRDMAARGVCIPAEDIRAAIKEARR